MNAVLAVQIITITVAVLAIARLVYGVAQRRALISQGYGVAAIGPSEAEGRNVEAKVVRIPEVIHGWSIDAVSERPYTVITIGHNGEDVSARYEGEAASQIDPESLEALLGPTTDAGETSAAVNFETLGFVRGVVQVGPGQIKFVEPGDLLEPEYLRAVVRELVRLGQQAEETASEAEPIVA